jgi:hypothetical protein
MNNMFHSIVFFVCQALSPPYVNKFCVEARLEAKIAEILVLVVFGTTIRKGFWNNCHLNFLVSNFLNKFSIFDKTLKRIAVLLIK